MWTFEKLDKIFVKANKVKNHSALWKSYKYRVGFTTEIFERDRVL